MLPSDIILAAQSATISALSLPRAPVSPPDPAVVDAILAKLPESAAAGKRLDPDATHFLISRWDPRDRAAVMLGAAVCDRLEALGFTIHADLDTSQFRSIPRAIFLSYEDLATVAALEVERRSSWIDEARALWIRFAGSDATVDTMPQGFLLFVTHRDCAPAVDPRAHHRGARPAPKTWESREDWSGSTPVEIVALAVDALRPLRWDLDDVEKAWKTRTGGSVAPSFGLWSDEAEGSRPVPTLIFVAEGSACPEHTVAWTDVYAMTSDELVAKAAGALGLEERPQGRRAAGRGGAAGKGIGA